MKRWWLCPFGLFDQVHDMWLTVWPYLWHMADFYHVIYLDKSMTRGSEFGQIYDMWLTVDLWSVWTHWWQFDRCDILVYLASIWKVTQCDHHYSGMDWDILKLNLNILIFGWVRVKKMFFSSSNSKNRKQFGVVHKSNVVELFSLSMSRIYLRNAQAMPKICPRCPQYIIKIFPKYSQDLP